MKTIARGGITYAVIGNINEATEGWTFCDGASPLQWGIGSFQSGQDLLAHYHNSRDRIKNHKTMEFIYIARGSVVVYFYDGNNSFHNEVLSMGSFVFLIDGTHGFHVLSDDTRLIEVKNGPFTEKDKVKI